MLVDSCSHVQGEMVVSSGECVRRLKHLSEEELDEFGAPKEKETFFFQLTVPTRAASIAWGVGPFVAVDVEVRHDLSVQCYCLPSRRDATEYCTKWLKGVRVDESTGCWIRFFLTR